MNTRPWLMAALLMIFAAVAVAQAQQPKSALSTAEKAAIRAVIDDQLRAFRDDDDEAAFVHATPELQKQFGSAAAFLGMVKSAYYPLYRPRSTQFLEPAIINGQIIQPLQVVAENGAVVVALYTLLQDADQRWKISGCRLAPSSLEST